MFEYKSMSSAVLSPLAGPGAGPGDGRAARPAGRPLAGPADGRVRVEELQSRIREMQATRLGERTLQTHPALAPLLPGGALRAGAAYSVRGSTTLVMAMLAGPSSAGAWCGVVGMPDFGAEAAGRFGIELERLVLVPHPGAQWLSVAAALADVLGVVVLAPPAGAGRVGAGDAARLSARLRQRESVLIATAEWPQAEAVLSVSRSEWDGLGDGTGYLASRRVTVEAALHAGFGPRRTAELWLPAPDESFAGAFGRGGAASTSRAVPAPTRLEAVG